MIRLALDVGAGVVRELNPATERRDGTDRLNKTLGQCEIRLSRLAIKL